MGFCIVFYYFTLWCVYIYNFLVEEDKKQNF